MSNSLHFSIDTNAVATIAFDLENEKVNKLSAAVLNEFDELLNQIKANKHLHLLLIKSNKKDTFIAGADINEIKTIKNESDALQKGTRGQEILNKLTSIKIPKIALIDGACLGGGLELALACDYRLATDNKKTILGLPEVNLGIIPGFGGTQRLPRIVGLAESLKMILSGKPVNSKKAYNIGLVDEVIRSEFLEEELNNFIAGIITKAKSGTCFARKNSARKKRFISEVLLGGKQLIYYFTFKNLMAKTKGKYPAPIAAFEVIKQTYHSADHEAGFRIEAEEFAKLASGKIAKNLIEIFFISEEVKKDTGSDNQVELLQIKQAGVMGAGIMGGGIAWLFSNIDIPVRMKDISQSGIAIGYHQILSIYQQLKRIGKYTDSQIELKMDEVSSTTDYSGFKSVDLVVEAIVENIDVKKASFIELEKNVKDNAIIASNTSSLSITKMAESLKNPQRFVGMHFFNPVNKMPLIEVIKGEKTSEEAVATIVALSKKLGKTPIVVSDVAGFLVNRILLPYINEAGFLLQEGSEIKHVDHLIEDFGMPMGPFILADAVGIDVGYKVAKSLHEAYGERMNVCLLLSEISKNKELLGKKSGKGFYKYKDRKNLGVNGQIQNIVGKIRHDHNLAKSHLSNQDIVDRCIFIMINEAARCLEENVVKNHRFLDMAMIMGTGFPAFHGGLLKYADTVGIDVVVARLKEFSVAYGARFEPAKLLVEMDKNNRRFYH